MKHILALVLALTTYSALAGSILCEAKLVNTFSRTQVGSILIKTDGNKTITQVKKSNGTTLTSSSISKERVLGKNSFNFDNFMIQMKDNGLNVNGIKSLRLRRIEFGSVDLNYVVTKSTRFVSSNDGFLFGVCKI